MDSRRQFNGGCWETALGEMECCRRRARCNGPKLQLNFRIYRNWQDQASNNDGREHKRGRRGRKRQRVREMANLALFVSYRVAMPVARSLQREGQRGHDDENGKEPLCCVARHK